MRKSSKPTTRPGARLRLLAGVICALAPLVAIPSAAAAARHLEPLYPGASSPFTGFAPSFLRDAVIEGQRATLEAQGELSRVVVRGGVFYTPARDPVKIYVSTSYVYDRGAVQSYVNFLGSLWHSREITKLTMYVLTPLEVGEVCGVLNLACYVPSTNELVAPGEAVVGQASLETTVAHEYAHHVANHRSNDPWPANGWGPKRWATRMNVCKLVRQQRAFPGDEGTNYTWNPAEGWSVAYAYANGYEWFPIVAAYWKPDGAAAAAVKQDSLRPWTGDTRRTFTGRIGAHGTVRLAVDTPLDGVLHLRLRGPSGARLRLSLYAANRLLERSRRAGRSQTVDYTVCGVRRFTVAIAAIRGAASYTLSVRRP